MYKKQISKVKTIEEDYKNCIHQLQKETTKFKKKKRYELNKRRALLRKQNEIIKEKKTK